MRCFRTSKLSREFDQAYSGISSRCSPSDILDVDEFWEKELRAVNQDRLFGCYSLDVGANAFDINGGLSLFLTADGLLIILFRINSWSALTYCKRTGDTHRIMQVTPTLSFVP